MKTTYYDIKITTTEPCLGLANANKDLQDDFVESKAPTLAARAEELDAIQVEEAKVKGTTVFPRDDTGIFWWDYQMRGAFKGWLETLIELGECKLSKWGYKKAVDLFLFVQPRRIYIHDPDGQVINGKLEKLQRPLRATTLQGDRVAIASSEMVPAGVSWTMRVALLSGSSTKTKLAVLTGEDVKKCLELGVFSGFGQWRGGGWGRFAHEMKEAVG